MRPKDAVSSSFDCFTIDLKEHYDGTVSSLHLQRTDYSWEISCGMVELIVAPNTPVQLNSMHSGLSQSLAGRPSRLPTKSRSFSVDYILQIDQDSSSGMSGNSK